MPERTAFFNRFILIAVLLFTTGQLFAQQIKGEVQIYIFKENGMPLAGVETTVNEKDYVSNQSGFISFLDRDGTREYQLYYEDKLVANVTVPVRSGLIMEVMITVTDKPVTVGTADEPPAGGEIDYDETLPKGKLTGQVNHIETGEDVVKATVIFRGITYETVTDENGEFIAEVPEGIYSISIIHPDYSTRTVEGIEIKADKTTETEVALTPSAITLEAVTVFASADIRVKGGIADLIDETKNSGVVLNLIGAEQISKSGDSDAAGALSRVTGLTVVDGRYVYVRGMGERYSASYLNGAKIPSPEIDKRVVPLDLFPTTVIESMAIQKTFSPNLYGDFGGGTVSLRTTGIPEDRYKRRLRQTYNFSIGYDLDSTFTEAIMDTPGKWDWLGFDDGDRDLPELVGDEQVTFGTGMLAQNYYTEEQIDEIAASMPIDWDGTTGMVMPDFSVSAAFRDKVSFENGRALGWNLSLMYKNGWDTGSEKIASYNGEDLVQDYIYDQLATSHDVDIGGLFDIGYRWNSDLSVESTSLLVRTTNSVIDNYQGLFSDAGVTFDVYNTSWVESMLFSQRIAGLIGIPFFTEPDFNWQYTFSTANRYEPANSRLQYTKDDNPDTDDGFELYFRSNAGELYFANVTDLIHDLNLEVEIPFFFLDNESADYLDIGYHMMYQDRTSDVRRFAYGANYGTDLDLTLIPDEMFTTENIIEHFKFAENTLESDNYEGSHLIHAGYFDTDLLFGDVRMNAGLRAEYSRQKVRTYALYGSTESNANLEALDWLPAINCTIPFLEKWQVRLGGSKTVNRPDLLELSSVPKYGVEGEGVFRGNPDLERAEIINVDTRIEYYIAEQESLSIGGFYKHFTNAIETFITPGAEKQTTLGNVPEAQNIGGEFEWQLSLRYISDVIRNIIRETRPSKEVRKALGAFSGVFRDMTTSGNFSYIWSEIDYKGQQEKNTSEVRPLQGQSPWIINTSLGYKNSVSWSQDVDTHTSFYLNYNVFGPRITSIGIDNTMDAYEQPFHQLDLVAKHSFNEFFSLGFKAKNILDLPAVEMIGDKITEEKRKGRSFSISGKLDL